MMPVTVDKLWFSSFAILLLSSGFALSDNNVTYRAASREVVLARLQKYGGNNQQRESTLKKIFTEAGCNDQHLSEQPVKGSKLPNVVCLLPGSSEKIIIVGAHFDRVSEGDGVKDLGRAHSSQLQR
jgi:hypothetical protein